MLFAILVFFTQVCVAQAYKYISMEDGLGSQKVYRICASQNKKTKKRRLLYKKRHTFFCR